MTHIDRPLLIHVAAESEQRGRVVLASRSASPHPAALEAAFTLATAFDTRVDCLLVECPDMLALTAHSFARRISHGGRIEPLRSDSLAIEQGAMSDSGRRAVTKAAAEAGVRLTTRVERDGLSDALARACAVEGPWNIATLAEPVAPSDGALLSDLLETVSGATGIVCVGRHATRQLHSGGPVLVVVENLDRLSQMLRVAQRLTQSSTSTSPRPVLLLVVAQTTEQTAELDGHLRLLLADIPQDMTAPVTILASPANYGTPEEVAELLRRHDGHFVIARAGGLAVPANGSAALLGVIGCPLLLVR